jgi:hypothetical protein
VKSYRCTACGRTKARTAYAGWGLLTAFWSRLCGAESCCDECLNRITKYPLYRPYPVVIVGDQDSEDGWIRSGGMRGQQPDLRPDEWRSPARDAPISPDALMSTDSLTPAHAS